MNNLLYSNIRRNLQTYAFYYSALLINVAMVFIFISLSTNKTVFGVICGFNPKLAEIFKVVAFIIGFFSILFIMYSSAYFLKKRKKEIALYSLFGMRKSSISIFLVCENLLIGAFAIISGILSGSVMYKFILMILVRYMELEIIVKYEFNKDSVIFTLIFFSLIFLVSSVLIFKNVYRSSLLDLFRNSLKNEKPLYSTKKLGFFSIFIILFSYFTGIFFAGPSVWFFIALMFTVTLCMLGTFMFFGDFLTNMINFLTEKGGWIYKKQRVIWLRQITHRIRSNYRTMAILTVLIASILSSTAVCIGIGLQLKSLTEITSKYDLNYNFTDKNREINRKITEYISDLKDKIAVDKTYTLKSALTVNKMKTAFISERDLKGTDVKRGETISFSLHERVRNEKGFISFKGLKFKKAGHNDSLILNSAPNIALYVLDSEDFKNIDSEIFFSRGIRFKERFKLDSVGHVVSMGKIVKESEYSSVLGSFNNIMFAKMVVFASIFTGLIFILSTASILYVKIVSSIEEDRLNYVCLSDIGFNIKSIKKIIRNFTNTIYFFPLVMGTVHSAVAVYILKKFLLSFSTRYFYIDIILPAAGVYLVFYFFYYVFYRLTLKKSLAFIKTDIKQRDSTR